MARKRSNEPQDDGREGDLMEWDRNTAAEVGENLSDLKEADAFGLVDTGPGGVAKAIEDNESAGEEEQSNINLSMAATSVDRTAIKRANFSRLASKRVTGVLERLSVLKNLANTNTYEWTQDQHDKIFDTIGEKFDEVVKAFVEAKKPKARDSQLRFEV